MEKKVKISPFQLTVLLTLSRMFSVMAYAPEAAALPQGKVSLLTTLLSALAQYGVVMVAASWCTGPKGVSPLFLSGKMARPVHLIFSGFYWAFSVLVCVYTLLHFAWFLSTSFYGYGEAVAMALVLALCGGFAVSQGLEAFARAGAVFAFVLLAGLLAVAVGLWKEYDLLNLVREPFNPLGTAQGVWQGLSMNLELPALLLLMPYTRRKRLTSRMAAGWLGAVAALSGSVILMTTLSLGEYGGYQMFPVFAAASSARILMLQHLDAVFMAIWVLLGFVRITVFLFLASSMWGEILRREVDGRMVWANTGALVLLCLWGLLAEKATTEIFRMTGSGFPVLAGAVAIPLLGRLMRGKAGTRQDES